MPRPSVTRRLALHFNFGAMSRGYSTSNFDVSRPFTRESLEQLKSYFKTPLEPSVSWHPATDCQNPPVTPGASSSDHISSASPSGPFKPYAYDPSHPRHAAVLVPIANVAVPSDLRAAGTDPMQPSILLEVRSSNMRSHGGEVRQVAYRLPAQRSNRVVMPQLPRRQMGQGKPNGTR